MHPDTTAVNESTRYKVIFSGVCALILSVGLARFSYTPMLPIMQDEIGLTHLAGGWLATSNYAGYLLGALLASSISKIEHRFIMYRVGLIVAVLSTIAMGLTTNVMAWAALRFISGASSTAGLLLASGLVLNWLIRKHHKPELGLHFAGIGLGIVVSGLAVVVMESWLSWDGLWVGIGIFGIVFFIPAWFWLPAPASFNSKTQQIPNTPAPFSKLWLILFTVAYFCAGFGYVISATFIVTILEQLTLFSGRGGWIWIIVGLAATPSCFIWDRVVYEIGVMKALMIAYGLQTLSVLIPAISSNVILNLFSAILFGGTFVGIVSLTLTLIGRRFPNNPDKAMARLTLGFGVAQIVAPAMAGYIASATNSYQGALVITTAVMVLGMFLLRRIMIEERNILASKNV